MARRVERQCTVKRLNLKGVLRSARKPKERKRKPKGKERKHKSRKRQKAKKKSLLKRIVAIFRICDLPLQSILLYFPFERSLPSLSIGYYFFLLV